MVRRRGQGTRKLGVGSSGIRGRWLRALALGAALALAACRSAPPLEVVIYTSVDQPFAQPVLEEVETATGIRVRAVYDVEASKATGLASRLIAERARPRADLFWNSEIAQTLLLRSKGALSPYESPEAKGVSDRFTDPKNLWTPVGLRARVFLVNTSLVTKEAYPKSILEITGLPWRPGDVGFANPLFGTSGTQAAILRATLGPEKTRVYYEALKAGGVKVFAGNAAVRDQVVSGLLKVGLVDSDDATSALERGAPVQVVLPDQDGMGVIYIPSTLSLVAGGPNPGRARLILDRLASARTEKELIQRGFYCASVRKPPPGLLVDWEKVSAGMDASVTECRRLFSP